MARPVVNASALILLLVLPSAARADGPVSVDLSKYDPKCGVIAKVDGEQLVMDWPISGKERGGLTLDLRPGKPLIQAIGIDGETILKDADPAVFLTVGSREQGKERPPGMSVFNEFFDNPAKRPSTEHPGKFTLASAGVASRMSGLSVSLGGLRAGPFRGEWRFTVYPGSRLVKVEAIVSTTEQDRAFLYDAGLVWDAVGQTSRLRLAWIARGAT